MLSKPSECCAGGTCEHAVPMSVGGRVVYIDYCVARLVASLEAGGLRPAQKSRAFLAIVCPAALPAQPPREDCPKIPLYRPPHSMIICPWTLGSPMKQIEVETKKVVRFDLKTAIAAYSTHSRPRWTELFASPSGLLDYLLRPGADNVSDERA